MPWTETALREPARRRPRQTSDVSDRERALIAPLLPPDRPRCPAAEDGSARGGERRPPDAMQLRSCDWRNRGVWQGIGDTLVMAVRELEGPDAGSGVGVIDSRSEKPMRAEGFAASAPAS